MHSFRVGAVLCFDMSNVFPPPSNRSGAIGIRMRCVDQYINRLTDARAIELSEYLPCPTAKSDLTFALAHKSAICQMDQRDRS